MPFDNFSTDWHAVTLGELIPYDIDKYPLNLRITSNDLESKGYAIPIIHILFEYPKNVYDVPPSFELLYWLGWEGIWSELKSCGKYFQSPFDEVPANGTEYSIWKTFESLIVTRNGTEITNVKFADYGQQCEKLWSNNIVWIKFKENSNIVYRPHLRGGCHCTLNYLKMRFDIFTLYL